jgi:uncharacterized protein
MIHIKYKLDISPLHGIGLFADEDISKESVIYTASSDLDVNISDKTFESLQKSEQDEIRYWGFWDEPNNVWHVDFDVSKFINHSFDPSVTQNTNFTDAYLIAKKDIKKGDELTQNYLEFESEDDLKTRGIKI